MNRLTFVFFCLFCLLPVSILHAQTVRAEVSESSIGMGGSFEYRIIITGGENVKPPNLTDTADYTVRYKGAGHSIFTQIENNKKTTIKSLTLAWEIMPLKTGIITIPSTSVTVGGKIFETEPLEIAVTENPSGSKLVMKCVKPEVYEGEPVDLTITWFTPDENLMMSWYFETAFQSMSDLDFEPVIPQPKKGETPIKILVDGYPEDAVQTGRIREGEVIYDTSITSFWRITGKKSGVYTLPPARITYYSMDDDPFSLALPDSYGVLSNSCEIRIKSLPDRLKRSPTGVLMADGELFLELSTDTLKMYPGDPVTVKIAMKNGLNLQDYMLPPVTDFTAWEKDFIIDNPFPTVVEANGNSKTFSVVLKPKDSEVKEIPGFSVLYLDSTADRIRQAKVEDFPIEVLDKISSTSEDLEVFKEDSEAGSNKNLAGIYGNYPSGIVLKQGRSSGMPCFLPYAALILPVMLFVLFLTSYWLIGLYGKMKSVRNRKALEELRKTLLKIDPENPEALHYIKKAFLRWSSSICGTDSLDTDHIGIIFREDGLAEDFIEEWISLFRRIDAILYTGVKPDSGEVRQIKEHISVLVEKWRAAQ